MYPIIISKYAKTVSQDVVIALITLPMITTVTPTLAVAINGKLPITMPIPNNHGPNRMNGSQIVGAAYTC